METIGQRLKKWRKENKLTLTEISEKTGLSTGGLSAYERDEKQVGSKTLLALWSEYNIDIAWILTGKKEGELSPEEKKILDAYRESNSTGQELIFDYVQTIKEKFPKEQKSSSSKIG